MYKRYVFFILVLLTLFSISTNFNLISASYSADVYFTLSDSVYMPGERIELQGGVYQANYTSNATSNASSLLTDVQVNVTLIDSSNQVYSNYTLNNDSTGIFYSKSNYHTTAKEILSPTTAGDYNVRIEYYDPDNQTWSSEVAITVINKTLDSLKINPEKSKYNPGETVKFTAEAIKLVGDKTLYVANVSLTGNLRNSNGTIISSFSCTTGSNGKCSLTLTAPSTYGNYILELEDFKTFSSFSVIPFIFNVFMKDELGESYKSVFSLGEQGRVEVRISNASTSDEYAFSGYIQDSSGNVIKTITSSSLTSSNSFTNSFLFTVDAISFSYGVYSVHLTVSKTGDGSITSTSSFEVKDWQLSLNKKSSSSGFEYDYSIFPGKLMKLETAPSYRNNGTVISGINATLFSISLKDGWDNVLTTSNATWNATCGNNGCYEFNITSPTTSGKYILSVTLTHGGDTQTETRTIKVISGVMGSQSTDKDTNIKELFGTNEYIYLKLSAYNSSDLNINMTDAEIFSVVYMNGSYFSYTNVSNFDSVNSSNNIYEWAFNYSSQMFKLDAPKSGGFYDVYIFGSNRTMGSIARFIINPYDVCSVAKSSAGQYVWQFRTTDSVIFQMVLTQANNPLGKASFSNLSSGNGTGTGAACKINSQTSQVVSNATISILEVTNLESGAVQSLNTSGSYCQSGNTTGEYLCTLKPLTKWEGGPNRVKLSVLGNDGTTSIVYSRFESRAFYLYGWSQTWQNNPTSNITLNLNLYDDPANWWYSSTGSLKGVVTVKKVEYQGRDGEWLWPPVDSGYNVSNLTSVNINSGSNSISLPVVYASNGRWKTGYYRVLLQATTSAGDTDYGYAWFAVKLWDVYGQPIECDLQGCNYKSYFNSKENISLYVTISKAGDYSYTGGNNIYGNVSVGIKKIENCKTWPCKELNSSQYTASRIMVNQSSPGYWNYGLNSTTANSYIIQINSTEGTWGTGYYSVTLDVNGTDTGYSWFNTLAFYVETQPTNYNGSIYKYSIRGNQSMYFNVTATKSYKWNYFGGSRYNDSDYLNVSVVDSVLRRWDNVNWQTVEYNYPEDLNMTPLNITGSSVMNFSYRSGNWPSGYYWGELTLKNDQNETSTSYLWFNVQPFRVQVDVNSYNIDADQCINATLNVYEPDWSWPYVVLNGNYSIISVYEDVWSGYGSTRNYYTNYTSNSFNGTSSIRVCPDGSWSSNNGGYRYLNLIVRDNIANENQSGWLSFRAVPFQVYWGYIYGNKAKRDTVNVTATLTKPSNSASSSGRLMKLYQWRNDNYQNTREEYIFRVGNASTGFCYSNVSSYCLIDGSQTVEVYAPSVGWKIGYNYLQAEWMSSDGSTSIQDYNSIYFNVIDAYTGWFDNYQSTDPTTYYNYKYDFTQTENFTIRLRVQDISNTNADVDITKVEYAYSGDSCWSDYCRTYVDAIYSPLTTSNGVAVLNIKVPTNWSKGYYAIRATVSGSSGSTNITGGSVRAKDFTAPNLTVISPTNNVTYDHTISFQATTTKNSKCYLYFMNYGNFYSWLCSSWNSTNSSNSSSSNLSEVCNSSKYNFIGSSYYTDYISSDYRSTYDGVNSTWSNAQTGMITGEQNHNYTVNVSTWTSQSYGLQVYCYDNDYNSVSKLLAIKINNT